MSLILKDIVNERMPGEICSKFDISRGELFSFQSSCASRCQMVAGMCFGLGWSSLHSLLIQFSQRVSLGVHPDLLPLLRIPQLKPFSARCLYDSGFLDPESIASSTIEDIVEALNKWRPFARSSQIDSSEHRLRFKLGQSILSSAQNLVSKGLFAR
jgi:replicative superfamily II helicase